MRAALSHWDRILLPNERLIKSGTIILSANVNAAPPQGDRIIFLFQIRNKNSSGCSRKSDGTLQFGRHAG